MIDKVFPRKLNSSTDARVRGKDEMIDAVNVTIDDNSDDFGKQINAPTSTPNRMTRFLQSLPLSTLTFPLSPLWSLT